MTGDPHPSWHPDRSWADPLIALLTLLAVLAAGITLLSRQRSAQRPSERASLQGRILEVTLAGPRALTGREASAKDWTKSETQLKEPWDQALLAVLGAELAGQRELKPSATPAGISGERFRRVWLAAYAGESPPDRATREDIHRRLGGGYAADLLEAQLLDREGLHAPAEALRAKAKNRLVLHLVGLGVLGLGVLALGAGGLVLGIYLLATRKTPPPQALPRWSLSGRATAIILLTWFLAFFLSGNVARLLLLPWPRLGWAAIPLGYLLHAAFGLNLVCRAEGMSFSAFWQRVAPGRMGRDLAWGGAFLALAVLLVLVVALTSNLILKPDQSPQRDLQDLLRGVTGLGPTLALFFTVAGLAPLFEEALFRGFLLPVLARDKGMAWALALSALLFGAIHMQPVGLPTLSTLGFVMGLAMRQTGSLRTPVLMHACWNGGLFLLMRAFA